MTDILTLVSSNTAAHPLTTGLLRQVTAYIRAHTAIDVGEAPHWLSREKAAALEISAAPEKAILTDLRALIADHRTDFFITPAKNRRKKLLMADMDSTIVAEETLDELADSANIKEQISAITARAMNGEIDFKDAIRERVGLLKGLPAEILQKTLDSVTLNKGAKTLVATMSKHGAHCVLVSGGFTVFTAAIAAEVKFDAHHGNHLEIENETLTGLIAEPILDKDAKAALMNEYLAAHSLEKGDSLAIGDGANDLGMLNAAELGIGFHPKPLLQQHLINQIRFCDLTAALYAQGYTDDEIIFAG